MKKYLFILGLVGTALLTACSSADDLVADIPSPGLTEEEKAMIVEAGQDSDVPITLGVGQSRGYTRAVLNPDGNKNFITPANKYLGVFCLAQGKQVGAPSIVPEDGDILWNNSEYAKWLDNIPAKVTNDGSKSRVTFLDAATLSAPIPTDKECYYPFGNWYYYDFFAYYPRQQASDSVWVGQGRVVVSYTITGKEDIIWARAAGGTSIPDPVTSNAVKSYSAKYMRLNPVVPEFSFDHKLTQFVFSVKPHFDDRVELNTKGFQVTKMEVIDVYNQLELYVADKTGGNHGALKIKSLSTTDSLLVRMADGTDNQASPITVSTTTDKDATVVAGITPKEVGYVLVPTSEMLTTAGYTNQYMVSIELAQTSGEKVPNTVVTLPLPPGGEYEAGKKYSITLEIYNPTNIQATATLASWEDGYDNPDDGVIPVY